MRTTITIDDDVVAKLKAEMRKTGASFKEVVNESIRKGLSKKPQARELFEVDAKPLGNRPGINYDSFVELLEQAEGPLHK